LPSIALYKKFLIIIAVFIATPFYSQSNEGTHFWFGFMEHIDAYLNHKVAMISSKNNTVGSIQVPGRNWSESFSVNANDVVIIELPAFTENIGSEIIDDVGVEVISDAPVSVYIHQYFNFRSDFFGFFSRFFLCFLA